MCLRVVATFKGHEPAAMRDANFGMAESAGYRMAARLFALAEHFGIPVVTFVDAPGAYPSFQSEAAGQPEAIATNLIAMAGLRVPIVTVFVGEGGSGGALALAMGDRIAMLSDGYYGVITPEGAASILVRYPSEKAKTERFLTDCRAVAEAQRIYPEDLLRLGVIDHIIWETAGETHLSCDTTLNRIRGFLLHSLAELSAFSPAELVERRHAKFRSMGQFSRGPPRSPSPGGPASARSAAKAAGAAQKISSDLAGVLRFFADTVVNSPYSALWVPIPSDVAPVNRLLVSDQAELIAARNKTGTAKWVLDHEGRKGLSLG